MTPTLMTMIAAVAEQSEVGLIDLDDPGESLRWIAVHDSAMGGRSRGHLEVIGGKAIFGGHLSLENGSGFASVRTLPRDFGLAAAAGIMLRVRGDGRTYRLRLRTDTAFDGVAWQHSFSTTDGEWSTVVAPLQRFVPVWRGRPVTGHGPLAPGRIQQLGFMVAGGQAGEFRLEVSRLAAY